MIAKYHSNLEGLLQLRNKDATVRSNCQDAQAAMATINETLLGDDVLLNRFPEMVSKSATLLKNQARYDGESLHELHRRLKSQSEHLCSVCNDLATLEAFFTQNTCFEGMSSGLKKLKKRLFSSSEINTVKKEHELIYILLDHRERLEQVRDNINALHAFLKDYSLYIRVAGELKCRKEAITAAEDIESITINHEWVADVLEEKEILQNTSKDIVELEDFLKEYPIYESIEAELEQKKDAISTTRDIEMIEKIHEWIADTLKHGKTLQIIYNDIKQLEEWLHTYPIYKGILDELQKHKSDISSIHDIKAINQYHAWIAMVLNARKSLEGIFKDINALETLLNKFCIYKGIADRLSKHKIEINTVHNIESIKQIHKWIANILKENKTLDNIHNNLGKFRRWIKKIELIFDKTKWIENLEDIATKIEDMQDIRDVHDSICQWDKILMSIDSLLNQIKKMDVSKKDFADIYEAISKLSEKKELSSDIIKSFEEKLLKKHRCIHWLIHKPYPRLKHTRYPSFWQGIGNILKIPINLVLCVVLWPILFGIRRYDIACCRFKSVLKW